MRWTREREQLEQDLRSCNLAILQAKKTRNPLLRQVMLAQAAARFSAVKSDWAAAKAREQSALWDLGVR
jgi:hypothetical protein